MKLIRAVSQGGNKHKDGKIQTKTRVSFNIKQEITKTETKDCDTVIDS